MEELVITKGIPQEKLYVESVRNRRFADFFRKRAGWKEIPPVNMIGSIALPSSFVFRG